MLSDDESEVDTDPHAVGVCARDSLDARRSPRTTAQRAPSVPTSKVSLFKKVVLKTGGDDGANAKQEEMERQINLLELRRKKKQKEKEEGADSQPLQSRGVHFASDPEDDPMVQWMEKEIVHRLKELDSQLVFLAHSIETQLATGPNSPGAPSRSSATMKIHPSASLTAPDSPTKGQRPRGSVLFTAGFQPAQTIVQSFKSRKSVLPTGIQDKLWGAMHGDLRPHQANPGRASPDAGQNVASLTSVMIPTCGDEIGHRGSNGSMNSMSSCPITEEESSAGRGSVGGNEVMHYESMNSQVSLRGRPTRSSRARDSSRRSRPVSEFKSKGAERKIWHFLEEPESSFGAHVFANFAQGVIFMSVVVNLLQTLEPSPFDSVHAAILDTAFDVSFTLELSARIIFCPNMWIILIGSPNAYIDLIASVPSLILRIVIGFVLPDDDGFARSFLLFVLPVLRLLKMLRRFQHFSLLLRAFRLAFEALPFLFFTLSVMVLISSAVIYFVEPRTHIETFPMAIWLSVVTMTTVGYGDVVPSTGAGRATILVLIFCSALYMALPIGIVGSAFSSVWEDRHRVLLLQRLRQRLDQAGYTAADIPKLFISFDQNKDGELSMEEFQEMIAWMNIAVTHERAVELFHIFDTDGSGGIDDNEFVQSIWPHHFEQIYLGRATEANTEDGAIMHGSCESLDDRGSCESCESCDGYG